MQLQEVAATLLPLPCNISKIPNVFVFPALACLKKSFSNVLFKAQWCISIIQLLQLQSQERLQYSTFSGNVKDLLIEIRKLKLYL